MKAVQVTLEEDLLRELARDYLRRERERRIDGHGVKPGS